MERPPRPQGYASIQGRRASGVSASWISGTLQLSRKQSVGKSTYIVELNSDVYECVSAGSDQFKGEVRIHSGISERGLSRFLKRRTMSAKLAAVQKYCCLRRSSLPAVTNYDER